MRKGNKGAVFHVSHMAGIVMRFIRRRNASIRRALHPLTLRLSRVKHHLTRRFPFMRTLWFRAVAYTLIVAMVLPSFALIAAQIMANSRYKLSTRALSLVGTSTIDTKLIKNTDTAISYNRADEAAPSDVQKVIELAATKQDATGKKPYQAELSKDPSKGITFSDSKGERSINLKPRFSTIEPRLVDGRAIYPSGSEKHVYSFKKNGIKSDIILTKAPEDATKTFQWELTLGTDLEARLLPGGGVGIYSPDPLLYGDLTISDQKSQSLIDNARKNGDKNHLVFELPAPFLVDATNTKHYDDVAYTLDTTNGTILTLSAKNLQTYQYPLSIDPTIVVTTTADFQQNTGDMSNTDFSTSGEIRRGSRGVGEINTWTTDTSSYFSIPRYIHTSVASNGFLYVLGGQQSASNTSCKDTGVSSVYCNDVQYAQINADGSLGAWTTDTSSYFSIPRLRFASVVYNGYIYVLGGQQSASTTTCKDTGTSLYCNDVQYAQINADGSLGTWTTDTSSYFSIPRIGHGSVVYNGYMYVIGGAQSVSATTCKNTNISENRCNDVQYAQINADGSLGTWTTDTSSYFGIPRVTHTSVAYNGYLYIMGGQQSASTTTCKDTGTSDLCNDVQYAQINADGSLGTWTTDTSSYFSYPRNSHTSVAYNGFMYVIGGSQSASDTNCKNTGVAINYCNDVQYAPINADGSLGTWTTDTSSYFSIPRFSHTSVAYNGYIYVIGGFQSSATTCRDAGSGNNCNDVQYAALKVGGSGATTTDSSSYFSVPRYGHTSVVYNGYLYVVGGQQTASTTTCKDTGTSNYCNDVQYAQINSDGSLGTWTTDTSSYFTSPRYFHTSVAYNGYLYVMGGNIGTSVTTCKDTGVASVHCNDVQYAQINSDGSLGTWTTDATSYFSFPRFAHTSVVYNGYIYVIGGFQSSSATTCKNTGVIENLCNDVQYAQINNDGSLGAWTTDATSYISFPRSYLISVIYNGYMYIVGGNILTSSIICKDTGTSITSCNDVQYAQINSDGSLGAWTTDTNSYFSVPRYSHAAVAYNGYLYLMGGQQSASATTCKDTGTSVYCNDVQYAQINSDGSLGTWTTDASSYFSFPRNGPTSVAYNGYLYVLGGYYGASATTCKDTGTNSSCNDVQYLRIGEAGGVESVWTNDSSSYLSIPRFAHSSAAYNGYIYVMGGVQNDSATTCKNTGVADTYCNDVQYAQINADGSLGTWTTDTSSYFSLPRIRHASVAYNGYMYIVGGYQSASATTCKDTGVASIYCNDVQYAQINADGSLGTWTTDTSSYFSIPRYGHTSVAYNGYLYVLGGIKSGSDTACKNTGVASNICNDVQHAQINADGSLGAWTIDTSSYFSVPRYYHASIAYNGYLFVLGGQLASSATSCKDTGTSVYCNDVQHAPINTDGSIGAWTTDTSSYLNIPRYGHSAVAYNGYIYVLGGQQFTSTSVCKDSGTHYLCNDVQSAQINADGSIGTWNTDPNSYFSVPRQYHTSVAYNGYIYVVGGYQNDTATTCKDTGVASIYCNDVQYATLSGGGYAARYERIFDTTYAANILTSFSLSGTATCRYTVNYRMAGSDNLFGAATTLTNVAPDTVQAISGGSAKRYIWFAVILDDSACGTQSSITSFSLTYDAVPGAPTLLLPANSATNVSVLPEFRMGTTDDPDTFVRYKIEICSTSNCSSIVRTIDQTLSQVGWTSQSQQSGTAYLANTTITQYAVHQYQPIALNGNTQYWWRASAIDPAGTNSFGPTSAIWSFTTGASEANRTEVIFKGGNINMGGGVIVKP